MRSETIAVYARRLRTRSNDQGRCRTDYQTAAYAFDSADHGAALFNLEAEGYRYTRISNPTTSFLKSASPNSKAASAHSRSPPDRRRYLIRSRQSRRHRRQHRLRAAALRHDAHLARPRPAAPGHYAPVLPTATRPDAVERLIDENTKAVFSENDLGNRAGNVCDIEALARGRASLWRAAGRRQYGRDANPAETVRLRRRHIDSFADEIPRRPRHHARRRDRRQRSLPLDRERPPLSDLQRARRILSRPRLHQTVRTQRLYPARAQRLSAHHGLGAFAVQRFPAAAG